MMRSQGVRIRMFFVAGLVAAIVSSAGFAQIACAATAKEIDASVDATLDRFHKQVKGAKEFAQRAKGLLVMPNVKKGGLIIGGEYGQGALRIDGKSVDYYRIISGSVGFQIGGQSSDMVIAFMTEEALKKFRESKGWEAGVDGSVALISTGGGDSATTTMTTTDMKDPVVGFIFDVKGLMGDMSFKGAKFSKIDVEK
jgi:lipid-binding SYLF domain-containing protein